MHNISSIQQVGIGSENVLEVFEWYRMNLGMTIPVFDEIAEAPLMTRYTGDEVQQRHAILALNKNGGGGIEFWQFKSRESEPYKEHILPGDLGISMLKMKVSNIEEALSKIQQINLKTYYQIGQDILEPSSFAFQDPFGNDVQLIESSRWYKKPMTSVMGGVKGVVIGVSNIEKSVDFYRDILNFDVVKDIYEDDFEDLDLICAKQYRYKRVIMCHSEPRKGPFAKLLGHNRIELIQVLDRKPKKIFHNRFWGDQGFIHLCFDVQNIGALKEFCESKGYPFTVDSAESFDMGKAAGRFAYLEDPDGTLIEFVETHKIPILPKIGWYYKLSKTKIKHLPDFLIRLMFLAEKKS